MKTKKNYRIEVEYEHLIEGDIVFAYINNNTHLCKILAFVLPEEYEDYPHLNIEYTLQIIDSSDIEEIDKIYIIRENSLKRTYISNINQWYATYFGSWNVDYNNNGKDLKLIKKEINCKESKYTIHKDIIEIQIKGYDNIILSLEIFSEALLKELCENIDKLRFIDYGTITFDEYGDKISGFIFSFTDDRLGFTIVY